MSEKSVSFDNYSFPLCIKQAINKMGFNAPTPIQEKLIPLALDGKDILGSAQTGSGKTAAYLLPFLSKIVNSADSNLLVLVPTRELAGQVNDVCMALLERAPHIKVAKVVGGARMGQQIQKLSRNPRVIVATPGRLNDHLNRFGKLLQKTSLLVVDEADRMLDMGFAPQLERVLRFLPAKRQSLLLSATMPSKILQLSSHFLNQPVSVEIERTEETKPQIDEQVMEMGQDEKPKKIVDIVMERQGSILIFARTQIRCDRLSRHLNYSGVPADSLHGGLSQGQRNRTLQRFRDGQARVLVATDLAARGIDVPHVAHVINYDLPLMAEDYVHRIGRTGRAGRKGEALSLLAPDEKQLWRAIKKLTTGEDLPAEKGFRKPKRSFGRFKGRKGGFRSQNKSHNGGKHVHRY